MVKALNGLVQSLHMYDSGGATKMEYRYEQVTERGRVAIPIHYTKEDVHIWRQKLVANVDRKFEEIWPQLSDEVKLKINKSNL